MNNLDIEMGTILIWDAVKGSGVIRSKSDQLIYFKMIDIEVGIPREGEIVQFVLDKSGQNLVAQRVVILADAARKAISYRT